MFDDCDPRGKLNDDCDGRSIGAGNCVGAEPKENALRLFSLRKGVWVFEWTFCSVLFEGFEACDCVNIYDCCKYTRRVTYDLP